MYNRSSTTRTDKIQATDGVTYAFHMLTTLVFSFVRSLRGNKLGTEGWCAIFRALRDNKDNKIESWDLSSERIGPEIAKALAEYVSASTAVRSLKCALAF